MHEYKRQHRNALNIACLLYTSDLAVQLGHAVDAVGGVGADVCHAHLIVTDPVSYTHLLRLHRGAQGAGARGNEHQ